MVRGLGLTSGYRRFCWPWWRHWLDPRTYWVACKTFYQRGVYGWSERDVWSVDMYLSEVIAEMLEEYLQTSPHIFYEDTDDTYLQDEKIWTDQERQQQREALQKRSDVRRVIAAFRADANECTTMMCDHEINWDEKKEHAEYWMAERKWAFGWLQEHLSGLWT